MYVAVILNGRVVDVREFREGDMLAPWERFIPAMIPVGTGWLFREGRFLPPQ